MPAFDVINSRGVSVTTVNVGTTTAALFPVEIPGDGIAPYPPIIGNDLYHLLEHFAETTEPTNPVEGMIWYKVGGVPHYFNGVKFIPMLGAQNSTAFGFEMLPTALDIDFTVAATVPIFTAPGDGTSWHPTNLILIPQAAFDVTTNALFNLQITAAEDVLEDSQIITPTPTKHGFFSNEGMTTFAENVDTISLEVTIPATGGGALDLRYDAFLFGLNRE